MPSLEESLYENRGDPLIEIVIPLLVALILGGLGLAVWRSVGGPAESRMSLAVRLVVVGLVAMLLVIASVW